MGSEGMGRQTLDTHFANIILSDTVRAAEVSRGGSS